MPSWIWINPQDRTAARRKEQLLERIDQWWDAFRARAADLDDLFSGRAKWDVAAWMHSHLQAIDERLMWEFGPSPVGHQLVITPESHKPLRPLVATVLERAPRLGGWAFSPYRVPESEDLARQMVEARTGAPLPDRLTARASVGEQNRIDLVVESPAFPKSGKRQALHQAFVAVESLLGEEALDKWVGVVEVERSRPGRSSLPPARLKPTVDALIGSLRDQLPAAPLLAAELPDTGAVLKGQPDEHDDYPAKADLLVASTMQPKILAAALQDPAFYSERFSRHGERFAYVKIDGRDGPGKFADRSEMEDALDPVLRQAGAGCVFGGGTGLRYSYIDLALTDVPRAIAAIRPVLQDGGLSRRTWLQFADCEWRDEWLGLWDDTPPPPTDD
jgi:hypothetical protein